MHTTPNDVLNHTMGEANHSNYIMVSPTELLYALSQIYNRKCIISDQYLPVYFEKILMQNVLNLFATVECCKNF